jgi:hydrogenase maturation protease
MNQIRIIGIGSPFGEDQLGWHIVDAMEQDSCLPESLRPLTSFIKADRPGVNLLELMKDSQVTVIIDAMQSGAPPGTIRRLEETEIEMEATLLSSHGFSVASALALARALEQMPARFVLYGIEIDKAGIFNRLEADTRVDDIARTISAEVARLAS